MTREEAYNRIDAIIARHEIDDEYVTITSFLDYDALRMARKALEQESVLDKIRTEIEEKYGGCGICEWFENYDYEENDVSEYQPVGSVSDILQIIDKYKAESEESYDYMQKVR